MCSQEIFASVVTDLRKMQISKSNQLDCERSVQVQVRGPVTGKHQWREGQSRDGIAGSGNFSDSTSLIKDTAAAATVTVTTGNCHHCQALVSCW